MLRLLIAHGTCLKQKEIAEKVLKEVDQKSLSKIVTKISLIKNYCPAEEYHQMYLKKR